MDMHAFHYFKWHSDIHVCKERCMCVPFNSLGPPSPFKHALSHNPVPIDYCVPIDKYFKLSNTPNKIFTEYWPYLYWNRLYSIYKKRCIGEEHPRMFFSYTSPMRGFLQHTPKLLPLVMGRFLDIQILLRKRIYLGRHAFNIEPPWNHTNTRE